MVLVTWVPCPFSSWGWASSSTKSQPGRKVVPARSGAAERPVASGRATPRVDHRHDGSGPVRYWPGLRGTDRPEVPLELGQRVSIVARHLHRDDRRGIDDRTPVGTGVGADGDRQGEVAAGGLFDQLVAGVGGRRRADGRARRRRSAARPAPPRPPGSRQQPGSRGRWRPRAGRRRPPPPATAHHVVARARSYGARSTGFRVRRQGRRNLSSAAGSQR